MINWNITNARQVERLNDLTVDDDEKTKVRKSSRELPVRTQTSGNEKSVRAIALLVAIVLTAIVAIWRNPESMLWWLLVSLSLSSWCCALGTFITEILDVAIEWIIDTSAYLRSLVSIWCDAAKHFIDLWIWSRFRARQMEEESYGTRN